MNITMAVSAKLSKMMPVHYRSRCPVNFALETFGDMWSLLIIRDIIRFKKRTYGEFLNSDEKISTNILADRLSRLVQVGILRKKTDQDDKRKDIHKLTQKGIDLYPMLLEMILWGVKYNPNVDEYYKTVLPLIKKSKQAFIRKRLQEVSDFANSN
jgi:DNA-binding HxlR family transcriptional regulator